MSATMPTIVAVCGPLAEVERQRLADRGAARWQLLREPFD
jgi:hypothetical protein